MVFCAVFRLFTPLGPFFGGASGLGTGRRGRGQNRGLGLINFSGSILYKGFINIRRGLN